jgi:pimeloyl-ACP methyl ester carboxylesterase
MTVDQFVRDCRDLVNYLCERFQQRRIYLAGHSWGTQLGVLTVQRYPELFHAYIGIAQVVNVRRAESISLQFALEGARRAGDRVAEDRLARLKPPGYDGSVKDLLFQRECVARYGGTFCNPAVDKALFRKYFQSHEYSLGDLLKLKKGSHWSLATMWGQGLDWDLLQQVPVLEVPALFLHGRCDRVTPTELVQEYFELLRAPRKTLIWFEHSGHCPLFEEPGRFQRVLIEQVLRDVDSAP